MSLLRSGCMVFCGLFLLFAIKALSAVSATPVLIVAGLFGVLVAGIGLVNIYARPDQHLPLPPAPMPFIQPAPRYNRYTKRQGNGGRHTIQEWHDLCTTYDHQCLRCHEKRRLTKDHIVPIYHGGTDNIDNIQPLCRSCNSRKGTQTINYRDR